jgi:sugar phosphate isomerase/epimerase
MDYSPIASALRAIDYDGYLCAEAFPLPDSQTAAEKTMDTVQRFFA